MGTTKRRWWHFPLRFLHFPVSGLEAKLCSLSAKLNTPPLNPPSCHHQLAAAIQLQDRVGGIWLEGWKEGAEIRGGETSWG